MYALYFSDVLTCKQHKAHNLILNTSYIVYTCTCICSMLSRNLHILQNVQRNLGIPRMHAILQNGTQSRNLPQYVAAFICLCVKMNHSLGVCFNISPLNTIHVYDNLQPKFAPTLSSKLVHSFSHLNTALLCVQSVPNIKKALVIVDCSQSPQQRGL